MVTDIVDDISVIASAVESLFTIFGIAVGGAWTYQLFIKKRQQYPHAETHHGLTCRPVIDGKILLNVDVTIRNVGEVLLEITSLHVSVKQMLPPNTELLMFLENDQLSPYPSAQITEWQEIATSREREESGTLQIEPRECEQFHYDFLIRSGATTVLLESYLANATQARRPIGWNWITVHDLKEEEQRR